MRSLFIKIFASLWLSHLIAALLVYALLNATRPQRPRPILQSPGTQQMQPSQPRPQLQRERGKNQLAPNRQQDTPRGMRRRGRRGGFRLDFELIRMGAVLVAATVVAYGLARYLAAPTAKLRRATQQLAAGNLTTRVAPQMGRRRDELADLGRDFDTMAERIEALLQAERRLLGDISHELRSPLARLQVALDLAQQDAAPHTVPYLERMERESARLNELIGQLLTLTRLESLAFEAPRESVNLSALVDEIAADADFEARGRNRVIQVVQCDECEIEGNRQLLRSALENVVRNAVRYTPENTSVEISLFREGAKDEGSDKKAPGNKSTYSSAIIRVRDRGPGVPEESLPRLFDPFYRVADARDRQSGGVGLGLSITKRAVAFHGGRSKQRIRPMAA
jgi:signal transduction histidine kinase